FPTVSSMPSSSASSRFRAPRSPSPGSTCPPGRKEKDEAANWFTRRRPFFRIAARTRKWKGRFELSLILCTSRHAQNFFRWELNPRPSRHAPRRGYPLRIPPLPPGELTLPAPPSGRGFNLNYLPEMRMGPELLGAILISGGGGGN